MNAWQLLLPSERSVGSSVNVGGKWKLFQRRGQAVSGLEFSSSSVLASWQVHTVGIFPNPGCGEGEGLRWKRN